MSKNRGKYDIIMYCAPIVMALIGLALFLLILPARYDKAIAFTDWLFSGTDNIIATLRSSQTVLPHYYKILATKFVIWLWCAGFILSLFMCGRVLQRGPLADKNILRVDYTLKGDIFELIRLCKNESNIKGSQQRAICTELDKLAEKFMAQKAFGYGNPAMTQLENDITERVMLLQDKVKDANSSEDDIAEIITEINIIKGFLDKRANILKK